MNVMPTRPQPPLLLVDVRDKGARGVMGRRKFCLPSPLALPHHVCQLAQEVDRYKSERDV